MKRSAFLYFCFFLSSIIFAQKPGDFEKLINQTNQDFSLYEQLSPYGEEYYALNALGLTKKEIKAIKENSGYENILSANKDSIAQYVAVEIMQDRLVSNIKKISTHPDFKKYDIRKLLPSSELSIAKSEDNKLYNFSFDAKDGGTYQRQISVMYYTDYDLNKTGNLRNTESEGSDTKFQFSDNGYTHIYSISTSEGTKYVLMGFVRQCTQCFGADVSVIVFKNNAFVQEFYYSIDQYDDESGIDYYAETKTIFITYQKDDRTIDCACRNENESEEKIDSVTGDNQQRIIEDVILETEQEVLDEDATDAAINRCTCIFVFDGKSFQLKKEEY